MKKAFRIIVIAVIVILQTTAWIVPTSAAGGGEIAATNNVFYLPAGTDLTSLVITADADAYSVGTGSKVEFKAGDTIDVTAGETTDESGNKCYKIKLYKGGSVKTHYVYLLSEIPSVYVKTSTGINYIHQNKENRDKDALVSIVDAEGNSVYSDEELKTTSEIKKRGNATSNYDKKPYQIKLNKKVDLFGLGKAKTWILLANYVDQSFLRNAIAFDLADYLGLDYSPKYTFVNLYIDGKFMGLYQLAEKVQIGNNRVEINDLEEENEKANKDKDLSSLGQKTEYIDKGNLQSITYVPNVKNPEDITGGYLIEMDNLYGRREASYFTTGKNNTYVVKSPEFASREQVLYIGTLVAEMEEAIYSSDGYNSSGRHFSEYADVDSLIAMYMTYEMTKNWDAYVGSTFFYKDKDADGVTSKIYAGPAWDFDHSFGNLHRLTFHTDKTELWAAGTKRSDFCRFFGYYLIQHEECADLLAKYAKSATDCIYAMLAEGGLIDRMSTLLGASAAADKALIGYKRLQDFESFKYYMGNGTDSAIGFLTDFMK
ncbi:MAG: CotH kinase family protein, partial [Clostridia bacterium]|nr:CotH kinase family protein [Clostridia bacterium]